LRLCRGGKGFTKRPVIQILGKCLRLRRGHCLFGRAISASRMKGKSAERIGLAIAGAERVGLLRGKAAARHMAAERIGIAEKNPARER
jgi:hypothetical protein